MKKALFLITIYSVAFADSINEEGVGPATCIPSLAFSNDSEGMILWSDKGNIAGNICCSFYDKIGKKFLPYIQLGKSLGIYPKGHLFDNGKGVIVFETTQGSINYALANLETQTFLPARKIKTTQTYPNQPALDFNEKGRGLCVALSSNNPLYSFYENKEQSFTNFLRIETFQFGKIFFPLILEETLILIASDLERNNLYYSLFDTVKKSFTAFQEIEEAKDCAYVSADSSKNKALIVFSTGASTKLFGKIGYSFFDPSTKSFTKARFFEDAEHASSPTCALTAKGKGLICWTNLINTGKNSLYYAYKDIEKEAFSKPIELPIKSLYPTGAKLAMNEFEAILCWFSTLSGRIEYSTFDFIERRFSPPKFVLETGIKSQYPQIKMNVFGEAILCWSIFSGVEYSIFDKRKGEFTKARLASIKSSKEGRELFSSKEHPLK